jgi:hypothetical protein
VKKKPSDHNQKGLIKQTETEKQKELDPESSGREKIHNHAKRKRPT